MLLTECDQAGVAIRLNTKTDQIEKASESPTLKLKPITAIFIVNRWLLQAVVYLFPLWGQVLLVIKQQNNLA